jgi:pimeloyl-ACP methyl ester carboxylesterase
MASDPTAGTRGTFEADGIASTPAIGHHSRMGELIDVRGISTWHEVSGTGEPVVLLHGGLTNGDSWELQVPAVVDAGFRAHVPDRRGHGRSPDTDAPFHYQTMADETIAYLEDVVGGPAHLVGHSDGANVAMLVAIARPDLVCRLVLVSGNFNYAGLVPEGAEFAADDPGVAYLGALYAEMSPDGAEHWPVVHKKSVEMFHNEPTLSTEDLAQITTPTLVLAADDDMTYLSHTVEMFEALPEAQLGIVPGSSHILTMEQPELVNRLIISFLTDTTPAQLIPRRHGQVT